MEGTGGVMETRSRKFGLPLLWALGLLGSLLWYPLPARSQSTGREVIAEVRVAGNRAVPTEQIQKIITVRAGEPFSRNIVQEDVRRLTSTGLLQAVYPRDETTSDGRIILTYHVVEHPNVVRDIVYKHANHISEKDLESITRLRKGIPLNPTWNKQVCFEIQEHLKKQGRYFANVTLEEGDKPTDNRVVFNITEGPVVRVRSIQFTGNNELATNARLRTQVDSSKAILGLIGGKYNPAQVENDVIKLEEYYRNNGYLNAKVSREQIFSKDFSEVDLIFHLNEGIRYRVENIQVEGTKELEREQVQSIIQVKRGEYYNEGVISADVRNITDYYGWRGYPTVVHKETYIVPEQPGLVRVQYQVRERPPAKVGQIFIVGNDVTQDRVIRRMLGLYPGQTLRYPEVRIAEANLGRSNIFETNPELGVRPTVTVIDDSDSVYKDVLVTVKETHTGSLMFGAGINSDAGLVGSVVLNERNFDIFRLPTSIDDILEGRAFRGGGQEFRMEAVPGTELQRYTVSFREPFLFDLPYSFGTSGYYYDRIFNEYRENRFGGRFTLGHQLNNRWTVTTGLRVENVNVSDTGFWAPADYKDVQGNNFQVGPRVGLTYDTRDSVLRPTEGEIVEASYEQMFGKFTFPIFNVEASKYFTTFKRADGSGKHVLAVRSSVSWAGDDTPVYERFFAGGFRSLRGFEFRGVGPNVNGFMVGGDFMFLNSLEYQVPVRANDNLYLVAFVDSGTVERDFQIDTYRVSAGVGLRIVVPMLGPVPIALDFGFPIIKGKYDREQIFSFYVGLFR